MKRYCNICNAIHDGKCTVKREYKQKVKDSEADKFRNTSAWRKKKEEIKKRDKYLCRVCLLAKIIDNAVEVHHIEPLKSAYDKRLDSNNLICLCRYHHEKAEKGYIDKRRLKKIIENEVDVELERV